MFRNKPTVCIGKISKLTVETVRRYEVQVSILPSFLGATVDDEEDRATVSPKQEFIESMNKKQARTILTSALL